MADRSELATKILKDVSRSFYLSIQFLPSNFRSPISIGYLLARASDTIADSGNLEIEIRKSLLAKFLPWLENSSTLSIPKLLGLSEPESRLMLRLEEVKSRYCALPSQHRHSVRSVLTTIIAGQQWDLERFCSDSIVTLENEVELKTYAYQVAGSVGEFWTRVGFSNDNEFSNLSEERLTNLGVNFGSGLQLINILRDVREDLDRGRCYLPTQPTPDALMSERDQWIQIARDGLSDGVKYADSLNGKRLRFATVLPAFIGWETLEMIEKSGWDDWNQALKIKRADVRRLAWKALKFAL